jgi:hypothetical protein
MFLCAFYLWVFFNIIIKTLMNTNGNTDRFFSSVYYGDIYRSNFSITKSVGNHQQEYVVGIYRGNQSWQIHSSVTTHTGGFISFISHVKRMVRFILITSIFLFVVIYKYI